MLQNFSHHVGLSVSCLAYGYVLEPFHVYCYISRHEYMH
jgi:hypothetical protein